MPGVLFRVSNSGRSLAAAAIVYSPWIESDGARWLKTWEPEVWGASTWQVTPLSLDPPVEAALEDIHGRVNVSSSLLHFADKEFVTKTFKSLHNQGHSFDAEDVRMWALRNGWKQSGSNALVKVAKKYGN